MPKTCYVPKRFKADALRDIERADAIATDYNAQGYDLTLRQLYYQFVARGFIPNTERSYKRLGSIVSDARLAGLLDWDQLTDRTRHATALPHYGSPAGIIRETVYRYHLDKWRGQEEYVEVWVEKEALAGVVQRAASELDLTAFSCRGYVSSSAMWEAAQRIGEKCTRADRRPTILHLGDHDPSGIDMTRDIDDRMNLFLRHDFGLSVDVDRIALNMDQIEEYGPPPNPAKLSDSRAADYVANYGYESWELDALEPTVLAELITDAASALLDRDLYDEREDLEREHRDLLRSTSDRWSDVAAFLRDGTS